MLSINVFEAVILQRVDLFMAGIKSFFAIKLRKVAILLFCLCHTELVWYTAVVLVDVIIIKRK